MISVVIPVYKPNGYLEECLISILSNSKTAFEVLLIDDCSGKQFTEYCELLSNKYPHISIIKNSCNLGVSLSRIEGVKQSHGEWVIFVDQDDILRPGLLDLYSEVSENSSVDIITGYNLEVNTNKIKDYIWNEGNLKTEFITNENGIKSINNLVRFFNTTGKLLRKDMLLCIMENFDIDNDNIMFFEDGVFPYYWFYNMRLMVLIDNVTYLHRVTGVNLGSSLNEKYVYKSVYSQIFIGSFLKGKFDSEMYEKFRISLLHVITKAWYVATINKNKEKEIEFEALFEQNSVGLVFKINSFLSFSLTIFSFSRRLWKIFIGDFWFKLINKNSKFRKAINIITRGTL